MRSGARPSLPLVAVAFLVTVFGPGCGRIGFTSGGQRAGDAAVDSVADSSAGDSGVTAVDSGPRPPPDPLCGDGTVNGGDECDDGNGLDGDGCDNDCTYSCAAAADCDDGSPCNGVEACAADTHRCVPGVSAPDGTDCSTEGQCRGGACAPLGCGDGAVTGLEDCDDMNLVEGDGCDNDCSFSCVAAADCDDGNVCTDELCLGTNICAASSPLDDGVSCDRDMDVGTRDLCLGATCLPSICGDGFLDGAAATPEQCDDGNLVDGDGCEGDCSFTCTMDAECADVDICNGAETCDTRTHLCSPGSPAADGTACPGGFCGAGSCRRLSDGGIRIDSGTGSGGCWTTAECSGRDICCGVCAGISRGACIPFGSSCTAVCGDGGIEAK